MGDGMSGTEYPDYTKHPGILFQEVSNKLERAYKLLDEARQLQERGENMLSEATSDFNDIFFNEDKRITEIIQETVDKISIK